MSIYDDLADSAYMDKDQFRRQLQVNSQGERPRDSSLNHDYNTSDSAKVNQDENFSQFGLAENFMNKDELSALHDNQYRGHKFEGEDSRLNYLLQFNSNLQPSADSKFLQSQLVNDSKMVKEELVTKRRAVDFDVDDDQFERDQCHRVLDDDIIHVQTSNNMQTGRFPGQNKCVPQKQVNDSLSIDQYKQNNDQLQQLLMQLQVPSQSQFSKQEHHQVMAKSLFSNQSQPQYQKNYAPSYSNGSGPNYEKLNQQNSILEIAKMQNSNASNSDNYINQSIIDRDFLHHNDRSRDYSPASKLNFPMSAEHLDLMMNNNPSLITSNNAYPKSTYPSVNAYSKQMPPQMTAHQRQVSDVDKENFNYNNIFFQIQNPDPLKHSRTMAEPDLTTLPNESYVMDHQGRPTLSKTNFYKEQQFTEQEQRRKDIMNKFDDIPIKELNKADGYQSNVNQDTIKESDPEEDGLTLNDRIDHPKWKLRMKAYKEVSELFFAQYQKDTQKNKFEHNPLNAEDEESEQISAFDQFAPVLQKFISDQNLVAQYEGLNCLYSFVRYAPDIKQVIFMVHVILLEKIQHNKPNLKDITMKIIFCIIKRDKSQSLNPELFKRFKNKNIKIAQFSMEVVVEAFRNQLYQDETSMKAIFKSAADIVSHTNKDLRDISLQLMGELYKLSADDASSFIRNLKALRPIQIKEINDYLSDLHKIQSANLVSLFSKEQSQHDGHTPKKAKSKLDVEQQPISKEVVDRRDKIEPEQQEVDLLLLVPENFNEIPYISQINQKKKVMEAFNNELEKLLQRKNQAIIANKEYALIYNVVTHMLEDSNALVFMEAIKAIEYLSNLLGRNIKHQKLKIFITLLTDKFKETKSSTVTAVNKALQTIIKKSNMPLLQLVDLMVCQIASSSKNPRVKQLILEKLDLTIIEECLASALTDEELIALFRIQKDKIIGFIQKDTNAGVRDAAVSLLTTFKTHLSSSPEVSDAVNALPKYRVSEICKAAAERQKQIDDSVPRISLQPTSSKKNLFVERPTSGKIESESIKRDIITQLRVLSQTPVTQLNAQLLAQAWDETIENLGEEGVQLNKHLIVSTVHQLLVQIKIDISLNQPLLEALLVLLKKIFCIERSVSRDSVTGQSRELDQAIEIALHSSIVLENKKQPESFLNVLLSAAGPANDFLSSLQIAILTFVNSESQIGLLDFVFKWLTVKCDYLLKRGVVFSDFEELRSVGLRFITEETDQEQKSQIIQILIQFKSALTEKRNLLNESCLEQQVASGRPSLNYSHDTDRQQINPHQEIKLQVPKQVPKSIGETIIEAISADFEKGLLLIKSTASNPDLFDFNSKEMVFCKLLNIVSGVCKNQQQQYQQAYALKALLWMREEVLGLEDSFKFATQVLSVYAKTEIEGRDNSVELYMLNHWVRDFSLRDLIDRVSQSSLADERQFLILLKWLMQNRLSGNSEDKWVIEDFRKLALLLAKNIKNSQVIDFFNQAVDNFGKSKVRDFMEIQLMHNLPEYNQFINWYSLKFRPDEPVVTHIQQLKIPQVLVEQVEEVKETQKLAKFDDLELRDALTFNLQPPPTSESAQSSHRTNQQQPDHSKLYKQLREQRKYTNQKRHGGEEETDNKYDQIISRLEAQLQINQNDTNDHHQEVSIEKVIVRPKTRSSSRGDSNNRYLRQQNKDNEDEDTHHTPISIKQHPISNLQFGDDNYEDAQQQLKESSVKESRYKSQLENLEIEKKRIDSERELLLLEKNQESRQWQKRFEQMSQEHEDVARNLKEANRCYHLQVGENEDLKRQIKIMQLQHQQMMDKFADFEQKLLITQSEKEEKSLAKITDIKVVTEEKISKIKNTFNNQISANGETTEIGLRKIQELLLNYTESKQISEEDLGQPLLIYYQSIKSQEERLQLINSLLQALDKSEDVLFALPLPTYKAVLDFCLKVFASEKAKLEERTIRGSVVNGRNATCEQNELTVGIQKIVSKLLNSKEFTTSLVSLFEILRNQMPENLNVELTLTQKQHLKVTLRCVARITKALPSEHPDLVRSFDVLLEMQKLFQKNPPESLREDLPCLEDFDQVYRGLKDVADKMMELQADKVRVFLDFVATSSNQQKNENAFIKYMRQVMGMKDPHKQESIHDNAYNDDEY